MRESLHSEEKIIGILKEHEAGVAVAELCRRHGMSQPLEVEVWRRGIVRR